MKKKGIALLTVLLFCLSCLLVACNSKVYHFKVTFYLDTQGNNVYKTIDANSAEDIPVPEDPVPESPDLEFGGWFLDKQGEQIFNPTAFRSQKDDFSVYPKWNKKPSEGLEFTLFDNGTYQVSGIGTYTGTELTIPQTYEGKNVTGIGISAFENQTELVRLNLPSTITYIGSNAFKGCTNLRSAILPSANVLTNMGKDVFAGCDYVIFYTSSSENDDEVYRGWGNWNPQARPVNWNVSDVYEMNNFEYIIVADEATVAAGGFSDVYITRYFGTERLELPTSYPSNASNLVVGESCLLHIGKGAFDGCTAEVVLPSSGMASIDEDAFFGYQGTDITLNSAITSIEKNAFRDTSAEIHFGNANITTVKSYAFAGYKGDKITLPASVEEISRYAFSECTAEIDFSQNTKITKLPIYSMAQYMGERFTVPAQITSIEAFAFSGASADIDFAASSGVREFVNNSFNGYIGASIKIPDTVQSIADRAFYNCSGITELEIPASVQTIAPTAFYNLASLTSIKSNTSAYQTDENGVLYSGDKRTLILYPAGKEDTKFEILTGVTAIAPYSFCSAKNLTEVTLPDSLTTISENAFENCSGMRYILINANNVKTIGDNAFLGCGSMIIGIIGTSKPSGWSGNYNPDGCVEEFNVSDVGIDEATGLKYMIVDGKAMIVGYTKDEATLDIPETLNGSIVYAIGDEVFKGNQTLKNISFKDSVTDIGRSAFENSALTSITAKGVKTIGDSAFRGTKLTDVTFDNVTSIGAYAFAETTVTDFNAPLLTEMKGYAFYASELKNINTPLLTVLEDYVFADTDLVSYTFPTGVTVLKSNVFANTELTSIEVPSTVTSIGQDIFRNCASLTDIKIGFVGATVNDNTKGLNYLYGRDRGFEIPKVSLELTATYPEGSALSNQFSASNIERLTLPIGITELSSGALSSCKQLVGLKTNSKLTKIGHNALSGCELLETIDTSAVTSIGETAFRNCYELSELQVSNVTSLGNGAFQNCKKLQSIALSASINTISVEMFSGCESITSITFAGDIQTIQRDAFAGCLLLKKLEFKNVTNIEGRAFENCYADVTVTANGTITIAANAFENYCGETVVLPDSVTSFESETFKNAANLVTLTANGITSLKKNVFNGCGKLQAFDLSKVTSVDEGDFEGCASITSVTLNDNVKTLPKYFFRYCTMLKDVDLGGITTISVLAFKDCISLYNLDVSQITTIQSNAFEDCINLSTITLDYSKVNMVDGYAFMRCSKLVVRLKGATVGSTSKWTSSWSFGIKVVSDSDDGNLEIREQNGNCAVYELQNNTYTLISYVGSGDFAIKTEIDGKSVVAIGENAFCDLYDLSSVTIGANVTSIGNSAFSQCRSLTSVQAPGVTTLGTGVFEGCSSLNTVKLGALTALPENTFKDCTSIETIEITATEVSEPFAIGAYAFENVVASISITLSNNKIVLEDYAMAGYKGKDFSLANISDIGRYAFDGATATVTFEGSSMDKVNDYAFADYSGESIVLSDKIKSIGAYAFIGCANLTELKLPISVTEIGRNAFEGVTCEIVFDSGSTIDELGDYVFYGYNGTKLEIPASVTKIGTSVFENVRSIVSLEIPEKVSEIGANAFKGCAALTTLDLKGQLVSIGRSAFANCISLGKLEIKGTLDKIAEYTFYGCKALTSVTLPDSVKSIAVAAFYYCSALDDIKLPSNLESIGNKAFYACSSLPAVEIPSTLTSIGNEVFNGCSSITAFSINGDSDAFAIDNGALLNKAMTEFIVYPAANKAENYSIPASVTKIYAYAFAYSVNLKTVDIRARVATDETNKTSYIDLTIEEGAFYGCVNLTIRCEASQSTDHSKFDKNWYYCPSHSNGTDYCGLIWGYKFTD